MKNADELDIPETASVQSDPGSADCGRNVPVGRSLLIILGAVAALIGPIAFLGIPDGFDLLQHIRFASVYYDSILSGNLFPGWAADDNYGFGSIGIRYYPPLAYYLLAITKMATGSWFDSFWITSCGWMLLGAIGVFLWLREWSTDWQPTIGGVIYVLAPYHTFQIYQAVLYAEFAAAGILPWCFLYLTRLCRRRREIDVVLFAVSYSLLILTHIPSTIIASACMAVYGLMIYDWKHFAATTTRIASAIAASLLATAFHLVRALTEMSWVLHNSEQYFANGYYDYKRYFFPIILSATPTRYVESMLWHIDLLNLLTILLILPAIILFWRVKPESQGPVGRKIDLAVILTGTFSIFMLSIASSVVWNSVSTLQKVQFPWRWMIAASLFGAAAFAIVIQRSLAAKGKQKKFLLYPITAFIVLLALFNITQSILPSTPLSRTEFENRISEMNNEEACSCWWPAWADRGALINRELAVAGPRDLNIIEWSDEFREFAVGPGEDSSLRIATFYHPHWKAHVNDHSVEVGRDENGAIVIPLPTVGTAVKLEFVEPAYLYPTRGVSMITWLILGGLLAFFIFRRRGKSGAI